MRKAKRPAKCTICRLFNSKKKKKKKKETRGRKRLTTPAEDKKMVRILLKLHKENPKRDVTARQVMALWDTECPISEETLKRRLRDIGRGWKKSKNRIVLSQADKDARVEFCNLWKHKPADFWMRRVVSLALRLTVQVHHEK